MPAGWRTVRTGCSTGPPRPASSPQQTPVEVEDLIEKLRRDRKVGPVQLAGILADEHQLRVPASTIYRVLVRRGISRLGDIDVSGEDLREPVRRYEWARPGDLVHIDVKKIGRIPGGGGWRVHGRGSAQHQATERAKNAGARAGYVYLHTAIDDHSRLAYTEELLDEKGATAAAFWARAVKFFRRHGIRRIHRVLSDNGACYRSFVFAAALAAVQEPAQADPALPAANQRQGRALPPHPCPRMGLQPSLDQQPGTHRRAASIPRPLQLSSTTYRTRRTPTHQPPPDHRQQPRGLVQLVVAPGGSPSVPRRPGGCLAKPTREGYRCRMLTRGERSEAPPGRRGSRRTSGRDHYVSKRPDGDSSRGAGVSWVESCREGVVHVGHPRPDRGYDAGHHRGAERIGGLHRPGLDR